MERVPVLWVFKQYAKLKHEVDINDGNPLHTTTLHKGELIVCHTEPSGITELWTVVKSIPLISFQTDVGAFDKHVQKVPLSEVVE